MPRFGGVPFVTSDPFRLRAKRSPGPALEKLPNTLSFAHQALTKHPPSLYIFHFRKVQKERKNIKKYSFWLFLLLFYYFSRPRLLVKQFSVPVWLYKDARGGGGTWNVQSKHIFQKWPQKSTNERDFGEPTVLDPKRPPDPKDFGEPVPLEHTSKLKK